jgi:hypothetical protein
MQLWCGITNTAGEIAQLASSTGRALAERICLLKLLAQGAGEREIVAKETN